MQTTWLRVPYHLDYKVKKNHLNQQKSNSSTTIEIEEIFSNSVKDNIHEI